jgi:hypothetical protein
VHSDVHGEHPEGESCANQADVRYRGVKRTWRRLVGMSANDPKRTSAPHARLSFMRVRKRTAIFYRVASIGNLTDFSRSHASARMLCACSSSPSSGV